MSRNPKIKQRSSDGAYYFNLNNQTHVRAKYIDAENLYKELKEKEPVKLPTNLKKAKVADLLNKWLSMTKGKNKYDTDDRIEQTVQYQLIKYIGMQQVATLEKEDIQNLMNKLSKDKYSYSTIKKAKTYLKKALTECDVIDCLPKNLFKGIFIPKCVPRTGKDDIVYYSEKELKKIYSVATEKIDVGGKKVNLYRLGDAILVYGETGMRRGELLGLHWQDVDFKKCVIKIKYTRTNVKNPNGNVPKRIDVLTTPKTKNSIREIPMSDLCRKALKRLKKITDIPENKEGYVLLSKSNTPVSARNLSRMFEQILYRAEMDAVLENGVIVNKIYGLHSLRHTFATIMINQKGANITAVSKLLGHADVSTTINRYVHTDTDDLRKAIALLD